MIILSSEMIRYAVIAYNCPKSGQTYLLVVRNADNACRPNRTRSVTRWDKTSGDALEEYTDAILITSAVGSCVENTRSGEKVNEINVFLEEDVM